MEDWQQWQLRAEQVATALGEETSALEQEFFSDNTDSNFRGFWPRFRDLKERVRVAPAIELDAKLALERRLRDMGSRAYRGQEVMYGKSEERRKEFLPRIEQVREHAASLDDPRDLQAVKRDMDVIRREFEGATELMPADRQAVWGSWRESTNFVWERLTGIWERNEASLRELLAEAKQYVESGNSNGARQTLGRFFEGLQSMACRQNAISSLRAEADAIRAEAAEREERRAAERTPTVQLNAISPLQTWKSDLARSKEASAKVTEEVQSLERQYQETRSLLDQAVVRGALMDKKRKLSELERSGRMLEQRIEQAEEAPGIGRM